ncbi:hypothetical protein CDAR_164371, partial [Caerostris darwini]
MIGQPALESAELDARSDSLSRSHGSR